MVALILKEGSRASKSQRIKIIFTYFFLSLVGISMMVPFFWMLSTSLKEPGAVFVVPPTFPTKALKKGDWQQVFSWIYLFIKYWIPYPIRWQNYVEAWNAVPFGRFYINSFLVTFCITFGQVFTSSLAAFAFARLKFPGRDKLFFGYLATMMIPGVVTMIPVFILLRKLGDLWNTDLYISIFGKSIYVGKPIGIDSYFALIVPGMFSAYGTFMLRQFFLTIPSELEEAAKIDGSSLLGIYWRIILPLSKPALATLTTFTFMGAWRDFMWPLIVTNSMEMKTLPVGLASFQGLYTVQWTLLMAASIIAMVPMLIVFVFNQRFFVEGIKLTGLKG